MIRENIYFTRNHTFLSTYYIYNNSFVYLYYFYDNIIFIVEKIFFNIRSSNMYILCNGLEMIQAAK